MKAIIVFKSPYYYLKIRKKILFIGYWKTVFFAYNLISVEKEYSKIKNQVDGDLY